MPFPSFASPPPVPRVVPRAAHRTIRRLGFGLGLALAAALGLAACGDDSGGTPAVDAATPDSIGLGVCDGRPCLLTIADEGDWLAVSQRRIPDQRCDFLEESKFLMPAAPAAGLQAIVFQDIKAHRLHLDFMTQALPEFFGGLSAAEYQRIVQRRATRLYWAGVLYRLVDDAGTTTGYGFDVVVEPGEAERLTEAEIAGIGAQLATRFHLPLAYAPVDPEAIYFARRFTTLTPHFPRACQFTQCDTPDVDCVDIPADVFLCGQFREGRTIASEHANKARIGVARRYVDLPRALGTYTVPALFGHGESGPDHGAIVPAGDTARYEVTRPIPNFIQRTYIQAYTVRGQPQELRWDILLPDGGGGVRLAEPHLDHYFQAHLAPPEGTSNDELASFGSCLNSSLEHWQVRGHTADGGRFVIDFQYGPPAAGSGPLFPTRAEVTLDGQTVVVDDYFSLVYAGVHHNWNNQYWILFANPIPYNGHPIHGLWLDEHGSTFEIETAHTLDADQQPLDRLDVVDYIVAPAP